MRDGHNGWDGVEMIWTQATGHTHTLTAGSHRPGRTEGHTSVLLALGGVLPHAAALLGQEHGLDVGQDASLGDGHPLEQLVQLLVVADGQLEVAGVDPLLLVVAGGVAGQLENLSG